MSTLVPSSLMQAELVLNALRGYGRKDAIEELTRILEAQSQEIERLRAAMLVVTTDVAQDILEDPIGSAAREQEGWRRVAVAAIERLNTALRGGVGRA